MTSVSDLVLRYTRDVEDFPKPGVGFKDLSPLFASAAAFGAIVEDIAQRHQGAVDVVAGVEARGFIIGGPVALALGVGFVPVRKAGKLPGVVVAETYDLEYGSATVEVQEGAFARHPRVLVLDDVLATGGTAAAACQLIERAGGTVVGLEMLLELSFLSGRAVLADRPLHSLAIV